jgi:ADP-heptose:LPS heptosyltransferase
MIYYLIHSNSFGDTLASTPTLRYLHDSHNQKINVISHNHNVFINNPYIDKLLTFSEFQSIDKGDNPIIYESFTYAGGQDRNGVEKKFAHLDIRQVHAFDLGFQLLPNQMTYDYFPNNLELDVKLPEKYVVLHITTNWPNRTWDYDYWNTLIEWLRFNGIFTVLIGSGYREELHSSYSDAPLDKVCPRFDNLYGLDLTNQGTMSDMWWIINGAKCIVTMDTGPLHLAGTTDTHILQLGSAIDPYLRAPYRNGTQDYKYEYIGGTCNIHCNSNLKYYVKVWGHINAVPPLPNCMENKPKFECHPYPNQVIDKINKIFFK